MFSQNRKNLSESKGDTSSLSDGSTEDEVCHLYLYLNSVVMVVGACRRLSSVTLPAAVARGWSSALGQAHGRSGGQHCTAGQYGYVAIGRHLVFICMYPSVALVIVSIVS